MDVDLTAQVERKATTPDAALFSAFATRAVRIACIVGLVEVYEPQAERDRDACATEIRVSVRRPNVSPNLRSRSNAIFPLNATFSNSGQAALKHRLIWEQQPWG